MKPQARVLSPPPPSYPDSVSTFDPDAFYTSSSSEHTPSDDHAHLRRFSDASAVLPVDDYQSRQSSGSQPPYPNGKQERVLAYNPTASAYPSPPPTSYHRSLTLTPSTSSLHREPSSYFSVSETDDPAVRASLQPPHLLTSSHMSHNSSLSSPTSISSGRQSHTSPLIGPTRISNPPQRHLPELPQIQPPYTCTFHDEKPGWMVVMPPVDAPNQRPLYRVEVRPNVFMPTSHITSVYRATGELLARFEMGISRDAPRLYMAQQSYQLNDVFSEFRKVKSKLRDRWKWCRDRHNLHWDCRNELEAICSDENHSEKPTLARLIPAIATPVGMLSPRPPVTKLEVWTPHLMILDEIIVSALIVERKRQTPENDKGKLDIFN